jgi:hypothetical protein
MMKQVLFFATREDLLRVIETVESRIELKFARSGIAAVPHVDIFMHGSDIPDLGKATAASAIACASFLAWTPEVSLRTRHVKRPGGTECFAIDQLENPDTIEFSPGGIWNDDVLLHGRVATVSESPASQALMKRFGAAIKKHFVKIKAFYVGPQAKVMLDAGKRLTISAQSPREFDLALSPGK